MSGTTYAPSNSANGWGIDLPSASGYEDGKLSYVGFSGAPSVSGTVDNLTDAYYNALNSNSPQLYSSMSQVMRFREAPIRALASVGQTRVWNLLIDVVAQTGRYPQSASASKPVPGRRPAALLGPCGHRPAHRAGPGQTSRGGKRMKTKLLCIFLFGCAAPLLGQQPVPAPSKAPLPPGPLLKRTPDYSTWTITSQGTPAAPATNGTAGGGQGQQKGAPVAQLTVVKTGSTILEYYIDANGQRHEIWHIAGLRIVVQLGAASPLIIPEGAAKTALVCPDYGGGDIYSLNFAASDFAGLDWLSASTYSGMAEYQGNDCIVFK